MSEIGNLGSGTGKIYKRKPDGSIDTFNNTPQVVSQLMELAQKSRISYVQYAGANPSTPNIQQFNDPVYGSTFWFNESASAPEGSVAGADDITYIFIIDTKNDVVPVTPVSGVVTVVRKSRVTVIGVQPESGITDTLTQIDGDFVSGDIVIVIPREDDMIDFVLTIQDQSVDEGDTNIYLNNQMDCIISGSRGGLMLLRGGDNVFREMSRPAQDSLGVAKKSLSPAGGTYYALDDATSSSRIDTKRGLVILEGNSVTLGAQWNVFGQSVVTAKSQGTTLDIILDSPLYTTPNTPLIVFGISIPDYLCENYCFLVRAWYNDVDAQWEAILLPGEIRETTREVFGDGTGSVATEELFTINSLAIASENATARKTISHANNTNGLVFLNGTGTMANNMSASSSLVLGTACLSGWEPTTTESNAFTCPVTRAGVLLGFVMIIITDDMTMYTPSGLTLNAGDIIYFSSIIYPSLR